MWWNLTAIQVYWMITVRIMIAVKGRIRRGRRLRQKTDQKMRWRSPKRLKGELLFKHFSKRKSEGTVNWKCVCWTAGRCLLILWECVGDVCIGGVEVCVWGEVVNISAEDNPDIRLALVLNRKIHFITLSHMVPYKTCQQVKNWLLCLWQFSRSRYDFINKLKNCNG